MTDTPTPPASWRDLLHPDLAARTVTIVLGVWLNAADSLITATILPSVGQSLGGYAYFGWAVAAYLFGCIVAGASSGQLAERVGLARATSVAALVYAAGCAMSALAPSAPVFMLGRLVQGVGAGWIAGFCYVAIGVVFPERLWARMFSILAGAWGVATVVGPLMGGLFAQSGFWQGAFWTFAVQGVAFAIAAAFLLRSARAAEPDRRRFAGRTLALLATAIGLIAAADVAGGKLAPALLLGAGLATLLLAARVNALPGERLAPASLNRIGSSAGAGYAMIFLMAVAAAAFGVYGAALLQSLYGLSPLAAGYVVSTEAVGWTAAAFLVSHQPQERHAGLVRAGAATITAGVALLAVGFHFATPWFVALAGTVLGTGFGLSWSLATQRLLQVLSEDERATGASSVPTMQMIGGAVGAAAAGALANLLGLSHNFSVARAAAAGPWLFAAFIPLALAGCFAAARLMRGTASPPLHGEGQAA
ncbi:MFS transporter [Caulobacter sp. KR2-114]|uniref:MFS transporter n=1 Tax=Caulobacter sp. KR2-114 TaxID=3400912 RepID=UPI003C115AB1